MPKTLRGGTFNLKYGRDPDQVHREVAGLFLKHQLGYLLAQEFSDYRKRFEADGRFTVVAFASAECAIIVHRSVRVDRTRAARYGDGWTTIRGGRFPAATQPQARLDKWLYVRSVHWPTPSEWLSGRALAPPDRIDDLEATAKGDRAFLRRHRGYARQLGGDFNEDPDTEGTFSPRWVARGAGARIAVPKSREGHGRIDYAITKGARVEWIFKDTEFTEWSDHEPVIWKVTRG